MPLGKRGIDKVILGGMSADLCDSYVAALLDFRTIASGVRTTEQVVQVMAAARPAAV